MTHNPQKNPQRKEMHSFKLTDIENKSQIYESKLTHVLKAFGGLSEMLDWFCKLFPFSCQYNMKYINNADRIDFDSKLYSNNLKMIIRKIIVVKVISRDIYKLYGTFIKNKNIQKKKKKLKDWKVVAFYNIQQYATHLNVLIIPKKLKWKWTTFGSTHIMRENWKNYVFILWKKRKVWWHFKQCHAVKSKSHRSGGKKNKNWNPNMFSFSYPQFPTK